MGSLCKDRDIRSFLAGSAALILCLVLTGGFLLFRQMEDIKKVYLQQQAEAAGALLEAGVDPARAAKLLAGEISEEMAAQGRLLMRRAGYEETLAVYLMPVLRSLGGKWGAVYSVFGLTAIGLSVFLVFCLLQREHIRLKEMEENVRRFTEGNFDRRIAAEGEGDFALLSTAVNEMASSLNSHREAQMKAKEFLKDTISDISHQLKTPLAALFMYQDIIQQESGEEETVKKFAAKSVAALERMQTLVLNLLKIARLDADMIRFGSQEVKVRGLMEDIRSEFETRAQREGKEIILEGSQACYTVCDRDWMQEAVSNLVKNALDHTKEGGKIEISWEAVGTGTRIQVKDNGNGIHPEDMYAIFKRFYRSRFSNDGEGAGLGLPLAKAIVEGHEGTISVESALGEGALFTVFLPYKEVNR